MSARRLHTLISVIVLLALLIQPLGASAASPTPAEPVAPAHPFDPEHPGYLFRASVVLDGSRNLARLNKTGVQVLDTFDADGVQTALVLVDGEQLADLTRLGFRPQATDELRSLVNAQGPEKQWLAEGLQPLLAQADAAVEQQAMAEVAGAAAAPDAAARKNLRASIQALAPEQLAGVAGSASVDDDADGLTNTQEAWWCTDPLNPDTDSDGRTDGAEIQALKDWMANKRAGPPGETPWPSWPFNSTTCPDKDHDSIPNLAERWELGLNMDLESSDRDKFDDGQELFGVTHCPGGDLSCGYGDLPRSSDSGYVGAAMPSWVKAPGNHPLAAAFPVPEVDVVESSLHVQTVTTVTTDHTIASGTEKSYSTAKTEGTSSSVSDTTMWNEWEEVSLTQPLSTLVLQGSHFNLMNGEPNPNKPALSIGAAFVTGMTAAIGCGGTVAAVLSGVGAPLAAGTGALCLLGLGGFGISLGQVNQDLNELHKDLLDKKSGKNSCSSGQKIASTGPTCSAANGVTTLGGQGQVDQSTMQTRPQDQTRGGGGTQYRVDEQSNLQSHAVFQSAYAMPAMVPTSTQSKGRSVGGQHTTSHSEYEEQTITNGEAFSTNDSWGTATAVNSTHAADLWFTYKVRNTGTEYAREIKHLAFNIYIGDNPNPACTCHVGSTACGVPVDTVLFSNMMPGEEHSYTSFRVPLTLEQMKAVDLGGPVRVVVEDFDYGADELFYQDAAGANVQLAIEDGTADGDESIDSYLIPTWGTETVLDVLGRYFPHTTDENGMLIAVWTPEYRADTPAWCAEPQAVGTGSQRTLWCKHALSTADWWNVYTNGMGDGSEGFQDTPAAAGQTALFRFNQDSDLDGYSDRSEERLGTNPNDAASYPRPELLAGMHSTRTGNSVVATLSLLNTGVYDAYGVEAVMIAPNDTIAITNNTVGGSGRVRAQKQVIVGSRIVPQTPLPAAWLTAGHAQPAAGGYYTGTADRTYTFTAADSGSVGAVTLRLNWSDGAGGNGTLNFGAGYLSPTLLDVSHGIKLGLLSGTLNAGESFTAAATTPRDTFQYTIAAGHESDFTPPIVLVSYNDPQGNHRFGIPPAAMSLSSPTTDLMAFSGQMLRDPGVEIVTSAAFTAGANTTDLVVNNPTETALADAHLFLEFIDPDGVVVSEVPVTTNLPPGPNVVPVDWSTGSFSPAYDPTQDYIVMAFLTDYQGNILDTAARPLSSFQEDPKPAFAMAAADETWDFGTAQQGTLLQRTFTLGSVGYMDLLTHLGTTSGLAVIGSTARSLAPGDTATYTVTLQTQALPVGDFNREITVRASDPEHPEKTITIRGNVTAMPPDAPGGATLRPLDVPVTLSGNQGAWVEFTHTLQPDPASLHPVKVYSQDRTTLKGVGKYATPFGQGTASYDMFGDGRDGVMPSSGNLDNNNGVGVAIVNSGNQGAYSVNVTDAYNGGRINPGDVVLIHQTQGTGAGCWELNKAVSDYVGGTATIQLAKPLQCNYASGGNSHAQVQRVPQYTDCPVSGIVTPLTAWNGTWGGIFAALCSGTANITGLLTANGQPGSNITATCVSTGGGATGGGFRGGNAFRQHFPEAACGWSEEKASGYQGEGTYGTGTRDFNASGNGGGGGRGGETHLAGAGGGGGNGTAGSDGQNVPGYGGGTYGNPELSVMVFGGGGGGGQKTYAYQAAGGGSGGGILILSARNLTVSGGVQVRGGNGGNSGSYDKAGGGGAGGSILLRSQTASIGNLIVDAVGGNGGSAGEGNGGNGGSGRVRLEYCEIPSGTANPQASLQKLNCYVTEQVESSPFNRARLNLSESGTHTYQVQYGRRLVFGGAGTQTPSIRMPKQLYATASLDALVSNTGAASSPLTLSLDIGNDGTPDWTYNNATTSFPATLNATNLASALNAFMVAQTGVAWGADVDVPVRVQIDRRADVILTNLVLTLQSNQPGILAASVVTGADRPLDVAITISGMHNRGESWDYTHALGPDVQSLHPVKVFSHDFVTLFGVGKYGAADSNYVTSYGEFGDGKDGDLIAVSGQTVYTDDWRAAVSAASLAGQKTIKVGSSSGLRIGDEVMIIQVQGPGVGDYEFGTVADIGSGFVTLEDDLKHSYGPPIGQTCSGGFLGQYYTNDSFTGTPALTRCDVTINFDWGTGTPGSGLPGDHFSVRWTGDFSFRAGSYAFQTLVDDGIRVYVDGALVVERWPGGASTYNTGFRSLSEGIHSIRVDYYDNTGVARVEVQVQDRAQVLRVPHYGNVTVQSGGVLTAHAWDGSTGGIVAFRSNGSARIDGTVTANYLGYRGNLAISNASNLGYVGEGTTGENRIQSSAAYGNAAGGGPYAGSGEVCCEGTGGGGGGNGTSGERGYSDGDSGRQQTGGFGGGTSGNPELTNMTFGGSGGEAYGHPNNGGQTIIGGRKGGGIVYVAARDFVVANTLDSKGADTSTSTYYANRGGAGAGGSILVKAQTAAVGAGRMNALGGATDHSTVGGDTAWGGAGGNGRIRVEYCDALSGTTVPAASVQQARCYLVKQVESSPYNAGVLTLPEAVSGNKLYQVQYGRRYTFTAAGQATQQLRIKRQVYSAASLDALVSNTGVASGNLNLCLDVGNDGTCDFAYNASTTFPATLTATAFANALNTYLLAQTAVPWGQPVDVPVRVQVDRAADVMLTNLALTPVGAKTRFLRLPVRPGGYSSVSLGIQFGATGTPAGPLAFTVDIGADGTVDYSYSGTPSGYPAVITAGNATVTNAFNAYLAGRSGDVDVPIRITPSPSLDTVLAAFTATPSAQPDAGISAGDVTFSNPNPTETDEVTVNATLHNGGSLDTGPLTASFFATPAGGTPWYIGSAFVANVAAGGTETVPLPWNTTGFTGAVPVRMVVDPHNRVSETSETNNEATASLTIKTRPDLRFADFQLSDPEPVAGEAVIVTLPLLNNGQTTAGGQTVALYDGNPDAGGTSVGAGLAAALVGGATTNVTFTWTPTSPGLHRLFARADKDGQVNEYDEGNNDKWLDVYVGFGGAILLDSGSVASDVAYTSALGYGAVDEGQTDEFGNCGAEPWQTFRRDPGGRAVYRFDHLLPGHFYHLDLSLYLCGQAARDESVYVDGNQVAGPEHLGDGQRHRFSLRLDPALYTDRTISVTVETAGLGGAIVNEVNLYDVDYRYSDAGGSNDPPYTAGRGYGYLNGVPRTQWGTLPSKSLRENQSGNTVSYRYDGLLQSKRYQAFLSFWQNTGSPVTEKVQINGVDTGTVLTIQSGTPSSATINVPTSYYVGGTITVSVVRTDATTSAMVNEIAVEERTLLTLPAIRDVKVTNVGDTAASVSWISADPADGQAHYGPTAALGAIGQDERGPATVSRTHQVTLLGLAPQTSYQFYVTSADSVGRAAGGALYQFTTGPTLSLPPSDLIYGQVFNPDNTPAAGALVYVTLRDADGQDSSGTAAPLSALVDAGGYWSLNLGGARTADNATPFTYDPAADRLDISATQGTGCAANLTIYTANDSPAAPMTLACPTQVAHSLAASWNLIGLTVRTDPATAAEAALDDIVAQTGSAIEIERWWNGGWDAHVRDLPFNNFALELGRGYFIRTTAASTWTRTGTPPSSPLPVELYPGWNLLAIPKLTCSPLAEDVLVGIASQGGACGEIDRWYAGNWQGHIKGLGFNNFPIVTDQGYFVKCTGRSTYVPCQATAQSAGTTWPPAVEPAAVSPELNPAIGNVQVTNRRDAAFTVTWRTDRPSTGWVAYGTGDRFDGTAHDDRGKSAVSTLHHVTVTGLSPQTAYAFRVHAGESVADENGIAFQVTTIAPVTPTVPLIAYGQVLDAAGQPAVGALVRVQFSGGADAASEPLSALADGWGYWTLSLPVEDCGDKTLFVEALGPEGTAARITQPACAIQPVPTLTLGADTQHPVYLPMVVR